MRTNDTIFYFSLVVTVFITFFNNYFLYEALIIFLFLFYLIQFTVEIGKDFNTKKLTIILTITQLLLVPLLIYRYFNQNRWLVSFNYNMTISSDEYFAFMIPATISMIIGLELPLQRKYKRQNIILTAIQQNKDYLADKEGVGLILMIIGASAGLFTTLLSSSLQYVFYLLSKLIYVGGLYVYYSKSIRKNLYLLGALIYLLIQSLQTAMFGELLFTLSLIFILISIGKKISLKRKFSVLMIGLILVFTLQSIKADYRGVVWRGEKTSSESNNSAFFTMLLSRITNPTDIFHESVLVPVLTRFNQGMIQDKVMSYVPSTRKFANGETIMNSVVFSFVPRFLWPEKPNAGGHFNMEYFTGTIVEGYSVNIGPFGEAYGNFGKSGAIIFIFFYGLFFNISLNFLIHLLKSRPSIIIWFPIIFLNSFQVETDMLLTVNSLLKNVLFMYLCFWISSRFLRFQL